MSADLTPTDEIPRVSALSEEEFTTRFLKGNTPVLVTDAMDDWRVNERWTPDYLRSELGSERVHVYNDYFDFKTLMTLKVYFERHFDKPEAAGPVPYVRWYSKLRDVKFPWADAIFARLRDNWRQPAFLPTTNYALPHAPAPKHIDAVDDLFPARGLFISGRGARTGLHVDPWESDAVLCLTYGDKDWIFYAPDQAPFLRNEAGMVDIANPDLEKFPDFPRARPRYRFTQRAGEIVYVPRGWFHTVRNETDAISVTWNFVHQSTAEHLRQWSQGDISDTDASVLRLFVGPDFRDVLRPETIPA